MERGENLGLLRSIYIDTDLAAFQIHMKQENHIQRFVSRKANKSHVSKQDAKQEIDCSMYPLMIKVCKYIAQSEQVLFYKDRYFGKFGQNHKYKYSTTLMAMLETHHHMQNESS